MVAFTLAARIVIGVINIIFITGTSTPTCFNVVGELKKGLSGYLYVKCQNNDCGHINRVPYGTTHRQKTAGMPCFAVNTKLGTAMIDSVGGPVRVNNLLSTLNVPTISNARLKEMERRAGAVVEKVAEKSSHAAAQDAFNKEMQDIAMMESAEARKSMDSLIDDLGVAVMPDSSPHLKNIIQSCEPVNESVVSDVDDFHQEENSHVKQTRRKWKTPRRGIPGSSLLKTRKSLFSAYPCKTRTGMSCAFDTAWQKRGFDSLTSHTFFMSKSKYGKKVVKSIVKHRTCGTCKWWTRNRPNETIRNHRCVRNHKGSARLMESGSGLQGVSELAKSGTPVEYIEGDGDNTLIARLKSNLNINMKKRFDRNHIVKNIGKRLYALQASNKVKLSKSLVIHLQKCIKYAFAKNQGDKAGLEDNLKAIVPHQFGDHLLCQARFCGFKKNPEEKYLHRSLPYKAAIKDDSGNLRQELDNIFAPVIASAEQYADLGSSQQCEHANREVMLRAPKSLHYGESESLDFRVQETAAFINEGRGYVSEVHSEMGLSPGFHTVKYAKKCMESRKRSQEKSALPSSKRRRLILKQERATTQGANEVIEGVSYQSGVGLDKDVDIEELPDAVPRGEFKPIVLSSGEPTLIAIDLETTDLIRHGQVPHITQIAAMVLSGGKEFNTYVYPKLPIATGAQQATRITMANNDMFVNGKKILAVCLIVLGFILRFAQSYLRGYIDTVLADIDRCVQGYYGDADFTAADFDLGDMLIDLATVIIIVGVLLLFMCILAIVGAWRSSKVVLLVYAIIVAVLLLIQIVLSILVFANPDTIKHAVKPKLNGYLDDYDGIKGSGYALGMNTLMQKYQCCGVDNNDDFSKSTDKWKKSDKDGDKVITPVACCKTLPKNDTLRNNCAGNTDVSTNTSSLTDSNYNKGCVDAVYESVEEICFIYFKIAIALCCIMQVVVIVSAIMIYRDNGIGRSPVPQNAELSPVPKNVVVQKNTVSANIDLKYFGIGLSGSYSTSSENRSELVVP